MLLLLLLLMLLLDDFYVVDVDTVAVSAYNTNATDATSVADASLAAT